MKFSPNIRIVGYVVVILEAFFLFSQLIEIVPSKNLTVTRMWVTKKRVIQFVQRENRLPNSLSELLPMPGYGTQTQDGWGRPFIYQILPMGKVLIMSYGKDGVPGGIGDDADLKGIFLVKTPQGSWIRDQFQAWAVDPIRQHDSKEAP